MKKRILLALAALGTASMLFGFDSAETAETVMQKMNEATKDAAGVSMDMGMNFNVDLNIADESTSSSLNFVVGGDMKIDANMNPLAMAMDGTVSLNAMGMDQKMSMKMYGVTDENNQFNVYTYAQESAEDEGIWEYSTTALGDLDMEALMAQESAIDFAQFAEWGVNFELAPEAADVDGAECYVLSTVITADTLQTILDKTSEMTGQEVVPADQLGMVLSILNGLNFKIEYYVDTTSFLPIKVHMDLNDTDLSALSQFAAMYLGEMAEGSSLEIVINDSSIDAATVYGDAVEITVPQEALDAVANGEAISVDDIIGEVTE